MLSSQAPTVIISRNNRSFITTPLIGIQQNVSNKVEPVPLSITPFAIMHWVIFRYATLMFVFWLHCCVSNHSNQPVITIRVCIMRINIHSSKTPRASFLLASLILHEHLCDKLGHGKLARLKVIMTTNNKIGRKHQALQTALCLVRDYPYPQPVYPGWSMLGSVLT